MNVDSVDALQSLRVCKNNLTFRRERKSFNGFFIFPYVKFELLSNEKLIQFDMDFPSHKSSLVGISMEN
jgi:hypothetical protein